MPISVSLAGLRAVEALAAHGSITAAAAAMGYTPSAVSQQINRLERDLHQTLVERQGRRATLTVPGQILAKSAGRIILELESMHADLQAESGTVTGVLTVAAFPTAARGMLPVALGALANEWPNLELRVLEVSSHRAVDLVAGGSADLAVAHDWLGVPMDLPDGVSAQFLVEDISDVLVHARHPAAAADSVALDQLQDETWLYETGSVAHDFLVHAFRDATTPLYRAHMISEYATQIAMVAAGFGVALVPRMGRGPLPDSVRALSVTAAPLRRIHAVWRSSSAARPAVVAARAQLRRCGARTRSGQDGRT